jgi:predicted MFS family arabinose efflux permease
MSLTPKDRRTAAFAQQRVTMNLGTGLGAAAGGLVATTEDTTSFTILFLANAATFVLYMLILTRVPSAKPEPHEDGAGSYGRVLRHRPFMALIALNLVFVGAGLVPVFEFFPVFGKNEVGMTESAIGVFFLVNTLFIVVMQLPIAKALEGRRRMRALALMAVVWAASFPFLIAAPHVGATSAYVFFLVVMLMFGVGECLHGGAMPALVADLAEPRLMGRYMALSALSWQVAFVITPAAGGFVLAAAAALVPERAIPPHLRLTPHTTAAEAIAHEPVVDPVTPAAAAPEASALR